MVSFKHLVICRKVKTKEILELEQNIKLLEKLKSFLEQQVERSDIKVAFFDMILDRAEKDIIYQPKKKSE